MVAAPALPACALEPRKLSVGAGLVPVRNLCRDRFKRGRAGTRPAPTGAYAQEKERCHSLERFRGRASGGCSRASVVFEVTLTLSRRFAPPYPGTSLKKGRFMTSRYKQAKTVQPELGRCASTRQRPSSARTGIALHPSFPRRRESKGFSSAQYLNNARWIPAFAGMTTFFGLPGSGVQVGSAAPQSLSRRFAPPSPASGRG